MFDAFGLDEFRAHIRWFSSQRDRIFILFDLRVRLQRTVVQNQGNTFDRYTSENLIN